jgi:tRNA (mo5U34)-methyltransferase
MSDDLQSRVDAMPYWYHKIELLGDIVTPGWAPIKASSYRIPDDLTGKRVMDVGAWDGYWTFEALRRGASQVVAVDDFSDYLGTLETSDRRAWETFDLCREALGYSEEVCQRHEVTVYDIDESQFGRFDVVFFFGTLYHLRYPLLALDRLSAVCDGEIYVESAVLDHYSPYRGGLGQGYANKDMVMEFYSGSQYGSNATNWWVPSVHCLAEMLLAAGFGQVTGWRLTDKPTHLAHCRGFARGQKVAPEQ